MKVWDIPWNQKYYDPYFYITTKSGERKNPKFFIQNETLFVSEYYAYRTTYIPCIYSFKKLNELDLIPYVGSRLENKDFTPKRTSNQVDAYIFSVLYNEHRRI